MNTIGSVEVTYNRQSYLVLRDGTILQERRSTGQQLEDVRYMAAEKFLTTRGLSSAEHLFWTAQHQTTTRKGELAAAIMG
jgi:hypothetical protein